jgi:hypothetical protein
MGRHPRSGISDLEGSETLVFVIEGPLRFRSSVIATRKWPWYGRSLTTCLLELSLNLSLYRLKNLRLAFIFSSWP